MATINSINSNIPIEISKGGTNATSFTSNGVSYYDGSKVASTTAGNVGEVLTSNASSAPTYKAIGGTTTMNNQTGFVYTLVLTDAEKTITMTNSLSNTIIVPPNASVAFSTGTKILIYQGGAGVTNIIAGQGVTIANSSDLQNLLKQYSVIALTKIATDTWMISGGFEGATINLTYVEDGYLGSSTSVYDSNISPDQSFVALSSVLANKQISIWSWNGSSTVSEVETVNIGSDSYGNDWHPDGDYLAVAVYNATGSVRIYSWNGSDTLSEVESINITNGASNVDWHPNGNYLAVSNYNTSASIKVYSWNGTDTLTEVESLNTGVLSNSCKWSNSGDFLYIGSPLSNKAVAVYSWNGTDTLTEAATYNFSDLTYKYGYGACWYSDDSYLFVPRPETTKSIYVLAFNGTDTLTEKQTINTGYRGYQTVLYHDKYLASALYQSSSTTASFLRLYTFNKSTETLTEKDTISYTAYGSLSADFSSNGKYLITAMDRESNISLRVVRVFSNNKQPMTWTTGDCDFPSTQYMSGIGYGSSGGFLITGGYSLTAANQKWTIAIQDDPTGTWDVDEIDSIYSWGDGKPLFDGTYWIACNYKGGNSAGVATSTTGLVGTWTKQVLSVDLKANGYDGSNYHVIAGSNGALFTATDPTSTWTSRTSGFGTDTINQVAYGNGVWVAVGTSGKLSTATDPTSTWTSRTSGFGTDTIKSVAYGNGVWVTVGASGKLFTATDPTSTWTSRTSGFGTDTINDVAYGNDAWVAVGASGKLSTATDPTSTWTSRTSSFGTDTIESVAYGNNYWVAIASVTGGKIATATSGI